MTATIHFLPIPQARSDRPHGQHGGMWPADLRCRPSAAIDTIARDAVVNLPAPSKHIGAVVCDPFDGDDAA